MLDRKKNIGMPDFLKLETLIQKIICVKNIFYAVTIKNDSGAVILRKYFCEENKATSSSILK